MQSQAFLFKQSLFLSAKLLFEKKLVQSIQTIIKWYFVNLIFSFLTISCRASSVITQNLFLMSNYIKCWSDLNCTSWIDSYISPVVFNLLLYCSTISKEKYALQTNTFHKLYATFHMFQASTSELIEKQYIFSTSSDAERRHAIHKWWYSYTITCKVQTFRKIIISKRKEVVSGEATSCHT